MLSGEDKVILQYLKPLGKSYASAKEVCRRAAGKSRYSEDPDWAKKPLKRMEKKGLLEINPLGHFRIRRDQGKKSKIPLDPAISKILSSSGMDFSQSFILDDKEDYTGSDKKKKED